MRTVGRVSEYRLYYFTYVALFLALVFSLGLSLCLLCLSLFLVPFLSACFLFPLRFGFGHQRCLVLPVLTPIALFSLPVSNK